MVHQDLGAGVDRPVRPGRSGPEASWAWSRSWGLRSFLSENRRAISGRVVFWGLVLQWGFALLVLRVPAGVRVLSEAGNGVEAMLACALAGAEFVFGSALVDPNGPGGVRLRLSRVAHGDLRGGALRGALSPGRDAVDRAACFAVVMAWLMGTSGAESLNVAASLFLGQTEAPLTIRPYLPRLTNSELLTVMTAGMAHVSGGVMAAYFAVSASSPGTS